MEIKEIIVIVILFILALGFSYYYNYSKLSNINGEVKKVCFNEKCFEVEIADTDEERTKGLMFRKTLDENRGMLFIFEEERVYPFWMKNTLIPLDIIWLNRYGKVVFIAKVLPCEVEPCQIHNPEKEALYVLEVNSGISDEIGIKIGDTVKFKK